MRLHYKDLLIFSSSFPQYYNIKLFMLNLMILLLLIRDLVCSSIFLKNPLLFQEIQLAS